MGVRTYEAAPEPRRPLPGPGAVSTLAVAGLASLLLLINGRPIGEPDLSGLAGAMARAVIGLVGLVLDLDPSGPAVVGKVLAALSVGLTAGAVFAAAARRQTLADARACGLVLALGTTLAAASHSWSAEVPAAAAIAVALFFQARAEAEDDSAPAAQSAVPLAVAVMLAPATWALALVLLVASLARWRRAGLRLLPWTAASVLLALIGVALGSGPEASSSPSSGGLALFVSPARGALFFAPVVLVCLAGIVRLIRPPRGRHHWDQGAAGSWYPLGAAVAALAHLIWVAVDGSPTEAPFWGPRGLAPAWPPLLLLLPPGLALLRVAGVAIAAVSVAVQALGAFSYDGRWDRLHGGDPAATWDLLRSPIAFQVRERAVRLAVPAVEDGRLIVREHPLVIAGPTGSQVSFADGRPLVVGADATFGDVLLEGGARVTGDRLRLRSTDDALFFRVRTAARPRRLELRIGGRGPGILGVGEKTFWTATRWNEHRVGGTFRLRLPYSYADSGGGDVRLTSRSGEVEIASVALVPPGEPENVIRLR
jgi:hypothetical protein